MSPDAARASLNRMLGSTTITLRRNAPGGPTDYPNIRARVRSWTTEEAISGLADGARKGILSADDVEGCGITLPLRSRSTDMVVINDGAADEVAMQILSVDTETSKIDGVSVRYDLALEG